MLKTTNNPTLHYGVTPQKEKAEFIRSLYYEHGFTKIEIKRIYRYGIKAERLNKILAN